MTVVPSDAAAGDPLSFSTVQDAEIVSLRARRDWLKQQTLRPVGVGNAPITELTTKRDPLSQGAEPVAEDDELRTWNTVGLALSGGGVRSATFGLGVLQALDAHKLIGQIDYLSTVSGGGYIGAALSSTLQGAKGRFVFGGVDLYRDTDAVGHLRNYSNYLLPRSHTAFRNGAEALAVVGRGLVTNTLIVLATILLLALVTTLAYPAPDLLLRGSYLPRLLDGLLLHWHAPYGTFLSWWTSWIPFKQPHRERPFALTEILLVVLAVVQTAWAFRRSTDDRLGTDVKGPFLNLVRWIIGITLIVAFLDLQPVLIHGYSRFSQLPTALRTFATTLVLPTGVAATLATAVSGQLATYLKSTQTSSTKRAFVGRFMARAVLIVAAVFVPLMLELAYLAISLRLLEGSRADCVVALGICVGLIAITWWFKPNANSLHRFYRDRLSKAFLFEQVGKDQQREVQSSLMDIFKPSATIRTESQRRKKDGMEVWPTPGAQNLNADQRSVIAPRDPIALSELDCPATPFHLLNVTLNLQASLHANKRGRDCDFFVFTPKVYGGQIIGYYPIEKSHVDLATAVAISGAAASSAMGSLRSFRLLGPTLALLNVRLGYWLDNPRALARSHASRARKLINAFNKQMYLLTEMLGLLKEDSDLIYLTDGGHIENTGIYELLRRGCRLIIAVDAESDPDLACGSLVKLQRFARIDLGVTIDLPFTALAAANSAINKALDDKQPLPKTHGPHGAIGRIRYPNGIEGILLYIKASMTGDEPDYVLHYKRENPTFPHETTGDQFFSEEQFEAYRALGFHSADRLLGLRDTCSWPRDHGALDHLWAEMWNTLMHKH